MAIVDGRRAPVDTIVWATGFKVAFPFLDADLHHWRSGIGPRESRALRYVASAEGDEPEQDERRRRARVPRIVGPAPIGRKAKPA